jgi:hypothetical protein
MLSNPNWHYKPWRIERALLTIFCSFLPPANASIHT